MKKLNPRRHVLLPTQIYLLLILFNALHIPLASSQSIIRSVNEVTKKTLEPTVGRGYTPFLSSIHDTCVEVVSEDETPSYDFNLITSAVREYSSIDTDLADQRGFFNYRWISHTILTDKDRQVQVDQGSQTQRYAHHFVATLRIDRYYGADSSTAEELTYGAEHLLTNDGVVAFLQSCGSMYISSIRRSSEVSTIFAYLSITSVAPQSFTRQLKEALGGPSRKTVPAYRSLGCFYDREEPDRALPIYLGDNVSHDWCASACHSRGYEFFALQARFECWCGGYGYDRYGSLPQCSCNGPDIGEFRNCVYEITERFMTTTSDLNSYESTLSMRVRATGLSKTSEIMESGDTFFSTSLSGFQDAMAHAWRSTMDEQGGVIHSMFVVPWSNHPRFVQYSGLMAATQGGNTNEDENEGTPAPRQAIAIKKFNMMLNAEHILNLDNIIRQEMVAFYTQERCKNNLLDLLGYYPKRFLNHKNTGSFISNITKEGVGDDIQLEDLEQITVTRLYDLIKNEGSARMEGLNEYIEKYYDPCVRALSTIEGSTNGFTKSSWINMDECNIISCTYTDSKWDNDAQKCTRPCNFAGTKWDSQGQTCVVDPGIAVVAKYNSDDLVDFYCQPQITETSLTLPIMKFVNTTGDYQSVLLQDSEFSYGNKIRNNIGLRETYDDFKNLTIIEEQSTAFPIDVTIDSSTVLHFDFKIHIEGAEHAICLSKTMSYDSNTCFHIGGSDVTMRQVLNPAIGKIIEKYFLWLGHLIPTGEYKYIVFYQKKNIENDVKSSYANIEFRSFQYHEEIHRQELLGCFRQVRNYALGGRSKLCYNDDDCFSTSYETNRTCTNKNSFCAIDGNRDANFDNNQNVQEIDNYFHATFGNTTTSRPTLEIELNTNNQAVNVEFVRIYQRVDCCLNTLGDVVVELMKGSNVIDTGKTLTPENTGRYFIIDVDFSDNSGDVDKIRLRKTTNTPFFILEVEVWAQSDDVFQPPTNENTAEECFDTCVHKGAQYFGFDKNKNCRCSEANKRNFDIMPIISDNCDCTGAIEDIPDNAHCVYSTTPAQFASDGNMISEIREYSIDTPDRKHADGLVYFTTGVRVDPVRCLEANYIDSFMGLRIESNPPIGEILNDPNELVEEPILGAFSFSWEKGIQKTKVCTRSSTEFITSLTAHEIYHNTYGYYRYFNGLENLSFQTNRNYNGDFRFRPQFCPEGPTKCGTTRTFDAPEGYVLGGLIGKSSRFVNTIGPIWILPPPAIFIITDETETRLSFPIPVKDTNGLGMTLSDSVTGLVTPTISDRNLAGMDTKLERDVYRAFLLNYYVDTTVHISFDFTLISEGKVHGICLSNSDFSKQCCFFVGGTNISKNNAVHDQHQTKHFDYNVIADGEPVHLDDSDGGAICEEGTAQYLVFVQQKDVEQPSVSISMFSNILIRKET